MPAKPIAKPIAPVRDARGPAPFYLTDTADHDLGATMSDAIVAGNFFNDLHECPELSGAVTGLHTAYDLLQRAALAEPTLPRLARLADELLKIHSELWMMRHVVLLNDEAASEAALIDWCHKVAAAHPKPAPNLSTATAGGCN